jgi:arylsulfatase A-like enzyme
MGSSRREFLKSSATAAGAAASIAASPTMATASQAAAAATPQAGSKKPNIVIIMTDQQRADHSAREGFALDTTPHLDRMAREGVWFNRAYTSMPACVPARTSMFTGRWPEANRARTNHNTQDVVYNTDLIDVLKEQGYVTGLCGKNHCYMTPQRFDHWLQMGHGGGMPKNDAERKFDTFLKDMHHGVALEPTPFPLEVQCPHRAVSSATEWIDTLEEQPFFLWLTFPEPHNPFQAPEPYYSMFPPDAVPPRRSTAAHLKQKGFKYEFARSLVERGFSNWEAQLERQPSVYCGMLRMIDDQVKRFTGFLDDRGLSDNTIVINLADHGDFVGEYGLVRKGPELPEVLTRIPLSFTGPGIVATPEPHDAHVSIVDVMPTICDALDVPIPEGVQGRSLWPMLTGQDYPKEEFNSIYAEHGFGGLYWTDEEEITATEEGALNDVIGFDELNQWSQCGQQRMVRKGDWKLLFDMQGNGQLYNLVEDPVELYNLYFDPQYRDIKQELHEELMAWSLRAQDSIPAPRRRYSVKTDPHNYWSPHR